jgi:hypothetical protein
MKYKIIISEVKENSDSYSYSNTREVYEQVIENIDVRAIARLLNTPVEPTIIPIKDKNEIHQS